MSGQLVRFDGKELMLMQMVLNDVRAELDLNSNASCHIRCILNVTKR